MKKKLYLALVCLFISVQASEIFAQQANDIQGNWTLQYNTSVAKMETALKTHFNAMSTNQKNSLKKLYDERVFSYNNDGSYTQTLKDGRSVAGTWSLVNNQLTMTDSNGKSVQFTIVSLTNSALVLKAMNTGKTKMLLSEWHLTKN